ncbi:pseudaminic acid synthase [Glaciecola sp. XM2]|jgi:N-acetylneuraminate synthase|uniref:pseudaminic acid synthase n=1 Tax=Glaciecola sp. XM2 TaxID=1914931 RepID=UPI001BDDECDB|nr:pseudaminic acid synthase [Glaciecola sp. XM2]MBT1452361.1 pseudaminic acid synthase [Glaciecola sp. XM2]
MLRPVTIAGREISQFMPPYVIAEISANHNGDIERAKQSITAAKKAGASAVKIQTYTPDTMTIDVDKDDFKITEGLWAGYNLYQLYGEAYTPFEWHAELFEHAKAVGITLFSSPFDESAVDLLTQLDAPAFKVASFELVDIPLIRYIAKQGKPMLMSTGMASHDEIAEALEAARSAGCNDIALFHCISSYPAPLAQADLKSIITLRDKFHVQVGLSDHTLGNLASVVATSLGASVIEKHFTLSRADKGPDSEFSIEPDELKELITATEEAFSSLGAGEEKRAEAEGQNARFRRSLYFVKPLQKGEVITQDHVRRIRPGFGLAPKYLDDILGKTVTADMSPGDRVSWDVVVK